MAGIALFIYALMEYIATCFPLVQIVFQRRQASRGRRGLQPARLQASAGGARHVSR